VVFNFLYSIDWYKIIFISQKTEVSTKVLTDTKLYEMMVACRLMVDITIISDKNRTPPN